MSVATYVGRFAAAMLLAVALLLGVAGAGDAVSEEASGGLAAVDPLLQSELEDASGPVEVVVAFEGSGAPDAGEIALLREAGITTGITLRSLPLAGVLATEGQVEELASQPEVRSVSFNEELEYENDEATELTGVDEVRTDPRLTRQNDGLPVTGDGVGVLVNDSGIDATHPDLKFGDHVVQNVAAATNLNAVDEELLPVTTVEDVPNTDSTGGHGTHVAGTAGATGGQSGGKYEGVAPGADIVGYGSGAGLALLDVLGGFDYAITNQSRYDIRIITNSWGTTGDQCTDVDPDDPVTIATKSAFDRNMAVVFSAGNSGPEECTITGNYKKAPWVISAAAGDKDSELAEFSSRGEPGGGGSFVIDDEDWTWVDRPTVTAPGVDIVSTRTASPVGVIGAEKDLEMIDLAHQPFYTTLSGTSMAAPHVAGIVAMMLEVDPQLTPLEVKQIMERTATDMPEREQWEAGAGYVDAHGSVVRASRGN